MICFALYLCQKMLVESGCQIVSKKQGKEHVEATDAQKKKEEPVQPVAADETPAQEPLRTEDEQKLSQEKEEVVQEPENALKEELQEAKDRLLRLQAEFLNYKRRVEKEKSELYVYGCEELAKDLLPVIDNFERALSTMDGQESSLYQGIDMIRQQMLKALEKHHITEIEALGQPFDMHKHHAVMVEAWENEEQKNTVAEVMQKGYQIKERVLRPSMVKVYQS